MLVLCFCWRVVEWVDRMKTLSVSFSFWVRGCERVGTERLNEAQSLIVIIIIITKKTGERMKKTWSSEELTGGGGETPPRERESVG